MTSWKFLFPMIRFFSARKASLGLAKRTKGRMGLGIEPSSLGQEAKGPKFRRLCKAGGLDGIFPHPTALPVCPGSDDTRILLPQLSLLRKAQQSEYQVDPGPQVMDSCWARCECLLKIQTPRIQLNIPDRAHGVGQSQNLLISHARCSY